MLVREEYDFKRRISKAIRSKTLCEKWDFSSIKNYFILFLLHASLSSKTPSLFSQLCNKKKAKNITEHNFNYLQHSQSHKTHMCVQHICHHPAGKQKKKDPRHTTRFSGSELQWCICKAASRLQAALQGHKQMAWYYSPDLGLPNGNRAVNHHLKKNQTGSVNVWVYSSVKMCMVYLYCCLLYKYFLLQEALHVMFWLNSWPAPSNPEKQYLLAGISQKYKLHFRRKRLEMYSDSLNVE